MESTPEPGRPLGSVKAQDQGGVGDGLEELRRRVENELKSGPIRSDGQPTKAEIRAFYEARRRERLQAARPFLARRAPQLLTHLAQGTEVLPEQIAPTLQLVKSKSIEADLFRLVTLSWSVPVSQGFGRRLRFLVRDNYNGKLMGVIGMGDPVFNLGARDSYVGWDAKERAEKLVHSMEVFALGAIPPYNMLLGGKIIACLPHSQEVKAYFDRAYSGTSGIISGKKRRARLVLLTTCSALGRSSLYNRLKIDGKWFLRSVGFTKGYGHFHLSEPAFRDIRQLLESLNHPYARGNRFGQGPNWRFRVLRAGLEILGIDRERAKHGIKREVFVGEIAKNTLEFLAGEAKFPDFSGVEPASEIGRRAVERWAVRRAEVRPEFRAWKLSDWDKLISVPPRRE